LDITSFLAIHKGQIALARRVCRSAISSIEFLGQWLIDVLGDLRRLQAVGLVQLGGRKLHILCGVLSIS